MSDILLFVMSVLMKNKMVDINIYFLFLINIDIIKVRNLMWLTHLAFYFGNKIYIFELINTDYCILQGTRIEEGTVTHSAICLL